MQTIDLFDVLTIKIQESKSFGIKLSGTSDEIPYDERNLTYKAAKLFIRERETGNRKQHSTHCIFIHIEKNIPIAAGLAGGSTDAAGVLWGLNKLFDNAFSDKELHELCAQLGSDLNFCLEGGCQLATGRGEILEKLPFQEFRLSLIKPKNLGISAKEAYTKFSQLKNKPNFNKTVALMKAVGLANPTYCSNLEQFLHNDLEIVLINDYEELKQIKNIYPKSIMSGSGSTFFVLGDENLPLSDDFWIKTNLKSISYGVCEK
jgi:4-diphosphocytidyl-2-C-methyl-D-erythritol kinase